MAVSIVYRASKGSKLTPEEGDANFRSLADGVDDATGKINIFPYYHFHGFAGNQFAGDSKFFDLAGINHGVRGANLADATMFANATFVTTANPAGATLDTAIRIPSLNFDYAAGEKLIVWWLGKATPEASDFAMMGDGTSTAAGLHGVQARVKSTGKMDIIVIGNEAKYSGSTTGTPFDGTLHSMAWALDGQAKTHCMWVDEVVSYSGEIGFSAFGGGVAVDTKTSNRFNIGQAKDAPGELDGGVVQTRALAIIRLPATYTMPGASTLTGVFQSLRANPGKPVLSGAF